MAGCGRDDIDADVAEPTSSVLADLRVPFFDLSGEPCFLFGESLVGIDVGPRS